MAGLLDIRLLQHFVMKDMKDPSDFLAIAICNNTTEAVEWLLDQGVSPNAKNEDGDTMLHLAVWNDVSCEIIGLLIDRGADVNAQNEDRSTPLQSALPGHNILAVELLLNRGADVNIKDKHNGTALDKIFIRCYGKDKNEIIIPDEIRLKALNLLLDHRAQITLQDTSQIMWYEF